MDQTLFYRFGAALAIGFLVGLQREHAHGGQGREIFAGVRTSALFGLVGCTAAMIAETAQSPWIFVGVWFVLGALIIVAYFIRASQGDIGLTSEVAALVTILAGALCYWDYLALAAAIAVATTVLLALKLEMGQFVQQITREDVYATLKFAVVTAIILPVLPNQSFGPSPFDVLNPYNIWLMVVFISGISFLGYVLVKIIGSEQGIGLTGLLGGLVSSTAVTLCFTQRSRNEPGLAKSFALAIMVSWTVMFTRIVVIVATLNQELFKVFWIPLAAAGAAGLLYCAVLFFQQRNSDKSDMSFSNPFELGPAIQFGLFYALILLVSKTARIYFGDTGVYVSSIVAGLTDVDAITLSMAELSKAGSLAVSTGARAIVFASMANTVVKGCIVLTGGALALRKALWPGLALMLIAGIGTTFLI